MFLKVIDRSYSYASGQFLMLFDKESEERYPNGCQKLYAAVRSVRLSQCGHFMMGSAIFGGVKVTISGAYGNDGLPRLIGFLPKEFHDRVVELPEDLAKKYWDGDGWNSAGNESSDMRQWATQNINRLRIRAAKK